MFRRLTTSVSEHVVSTFREYVFEEKAAVFVSPSFLPSFPPFFPLVWILLFSLFACFVCLLFGSFRWNEEFICLTNRFLIVLLCILGLFRQKILCFFWRFGPARSCWGSWTDERAWSICLVEWFLSLGCFFSFPFFAETWIMFCLVLTVFCSALFREKDFHHSLLSSTLFWNVSPMFSIVSFWLSFTLSERFSGLISANGFAMNLSSHTKFIFSLTRMCVCLIYFCIMNMGLKKRVQGIDDFESCSCDAIMFTKTVLYSSVFVTKKYYNIQEIGRCYFFPQTCLMI